MLAGTPREHPLSANRLTILIVNLKPFLIMPSDRTSFRLGPGDSDVLDEIQRRRPDCTNRSKTLRFCIRITGEHLGIKVLDTLPVPTP